MRFDVHVWDIETGQAALVNARRSTFAPDGQVLASAQADGIRLMDPAGKVTGDVPVPPETEVFAVDFSDGRMLAWGGKASVRKKLARGDGTVVVRTCRAQELATFPGLRTRSTACVFARRQARGGDDPIARSTSGPGGPEGNEIRTDARLGNVRALLHSIARR